jgi:hypothetical protein
MPEKPEPAPGPPVDASDPLAASRRGFLLSGLGLLLSGCAQGQRAARLRTHQEWAPTACPGRSLQRYMVNARSAGTFG